MGSGHGKRRFWSAEEKTRIVAETREAGASVSVVARRHDVNANLVFTWRRDPRFNGGQAGSCLLPVEVAADTALALRDGGDVLNPIGEIGTAPMEPERRAPRGTEIDLGNGLRLRFAEAIGEASLIRIVTALRRVA